MRIPYSYGIHRDSYTYALDEETVRRLDDLARQWNVSKSEALRRAIRAADAMAAAPDDRLEALDELQASMRLTRTRAQTWVRELREERRRSTTAAAGGTMTKEAGSPWAIRRPPTKTTTPGWRGTSIPASSSTRSCRAREKTNTFEQWLRQGLVISMSSVAWAEFLCGPVSAEDRQRARKVVGTLLSTRRDGGGGAAELFNAGGRKRGTLPDCLIAATAVMAGAALATSNNRDFRRFERAGLTLIAG